MKKLSIRKRGPGTFEVGPTGHGPSVMIHAETKPLALQRGKSMLRHKQLLGVAAEASYRDNENMKTRPAAVRQAV
jgi:hypothetical protein